MMNPSFYDIALYMQSAGFGVVGENIFGGEFGTDGSNDIDAQILVLTTTELFAIKEQAESVSAQFIVRGEKRQPQLSVSQKAREIIEHFNGITSNIEMNGFCYTEFDFESGSYIGRDEQERPVYSINFSTFRNSIGA